MFKVAAVFFACLNNYAVGLIGLSCCSFSHNSILDKIFPYRQSDKPKYFFSSLIQDNINCQYLTLRLTCGQLTELISNQKQKLIKTRAFATCTWILQYQSIKYQAVLQLRKNTGFQKATITLSRNFFGINSVAFLRKNRQVLMKRLVKQGVQGLWSRDVGGGDMPPNIFRIVKS